MSKNSKENYKVHAHFHGEVTPEFAEVFNKMVVAGAKFADSGINNGDTKKRTSKPFCNFTVKNSHFCRRCHRCDMCDQQPKNGL